MKSLKPVPYKSAYKKSDSWREICIFNPSMDYFPKLSINVKQLDTLIKNGVSQIFVEVKVGESSGKEFFSISGDKDRLMLTSENGEKSFVFRSSGHENIWEVHVGKVKEGNIWINLDHNSNAVIKSLLVFYSEALGHDAVTSLN